MNWFQSTLTVETIKTEYRRLARLHHPDIGGDTSTMQEINAAYTAALFACNGQRSHDSQGREHTYTYNAEREQAIMDKLSELLEVLPTGVEVDLIGIWLWIVGTTKEDRATQKALKAAECKWHSKRKCWYWRPAECRHFGRQSRGSLAELAWKYGSKHFESQEEFGAVAVA